MGDRFCGKSKGAVQSSSGKTPAKDWSKCFRYRWHAEEGKSRAALSLQLKVTKNTGLTKLSIATPPFKLQQPQRKQPSGLILLCEPWHVQQDFFVFCRSLLTDKKYDSCHWELGQDVVWSSPCNSSCTVNPTQRIRLFTWWFIPKQTNIRAS